MLVLPTIASGTKFVDVLDAPAQMSSLATKTLLQGVTRAGDRLVAVGQRAHVLTSIDDGVTWKQSRVPTSSDLTAVYFIDDRRGWAVGHDGVVLHSEDGGQTWSMQLDGRKANALLVSAMTRKVAAEPGSGQAGDLLAEAKRYEAQGADKPFLDVWFADASNGYVVGAYNMIFRTTDGGASWQPWFDRTDNPKFLNLYAIRPVNGDVYIAGESGLVLKLDTVAQRFKALSLPYPGSLFGVTAAGNSVLVFGLRGNVLRSDDGGTSWVKVDAALPSSIVAATNTASSVLLADAGGRIATSADGGRTFTQVQQKQVAPITGLVVARDNRLAVVGPRGVAVTSIASR